MSFLRELVFERDCGVCAECGIDTGKVHRILVTLCELDSKLRRGALQLGYLNVRTDLIDVLVHFGFEIDKHVWEADHIRPKNLGGTNDLENLQTLCWPCHKEKTAGEAGTNAKMRRVIKKVKDGKM